LHLVLDQIVAHRLLPHSVERGLDSPRRREGGREGRREAEREGGREGKEGGREGLGGSS